MLLAKHILLQGLRYPLMAAMLLWALTLPGQEVEVYAFLFHGKVCENTLPNEVEDQIEQLSVNAFRDAKVAAACAVPSLQQYIYNPSLFLFFAYAAKTDAPDLPGQVLEHKVIQQLLTSIIQPNAP